MNNAETIIEDIVENGSIINHTKEYINQYIIHILFII